MDGTAVLAIYGAIVSTAAVIWNIYRDSRDRARLELSTMMGFLPEGGNQIVAHALALEKWPEPFKSSSPELFLGSSAYLVILPEEGGSGNNEVALAVSPVQRWDSGRWFQMPEKWSCTN